MVLNRKALDAFPQAGGRRASTLGDEITLGVGGNTATLRIVGIVEQKMTGAMAYVSAASFQKLTGQDERYRNFRVVMSDHTPVAVDAVAREIESKLAQQHFYVTGRITEQRLRFEVDGHFTLLVNALLGTALLIALVGLFGLASALSSQVVERTREFGIMRSIGAGSGLVVRIIIFEAMAIGLLSWLLALALAIPFSLGVNAFLGDLLFGEAFSFALSYAALCGWLVVVISGALLASAWPAFKAVSITVRESFA